MLSYSLLPFAVFDPTNVNNVYALTAVLAVLLVGILWKMPEGKGKGSATWTVIAVLAICIGGIVFSLTKSNQGNITKREQPRKGENNEATPPGNNSTVKVNRDIIKDLGTIIDAGSGDNFPTPNDQGNEAYSVEFPNLKHTNTLKTGKVLVLVTNNANPVLRAVHLHFKVIRQAGDSEVSPPPHFSVTFDVPTGKTIQFTCDVGPAYSIDNNDQRGYFGP